MPSTSDNEGPDSPGGRLAGWMAQLPPELQQAAVESVLKAHTLTGALKELAQLATLEGALVPDASLDSFIGLLRSTAHLMREQSLRIASVAEDWEAMAKRLAPHA